MVKVRVTDGNNDVGARVFVAGDYNYKIMGLREFISDIMDLFPNLSTVDEIVRIGVPKYLERWANGLVHSTPGAGAPIYSEAIIIDVGEPYAYLRSYLISIKDLFQIVDIRNISFTEISSDKLFQLNLDVQGGFHIFADWDEPPTVADVQGMYPELASNPPTDGRRFIVVVKKNAPKGRKRTLFIKAPNEEEATKIAMSRASQKWGGSYTFVEVSPLSRFIKIAAAVFGVGAVLAAFGILDYKLSRWAYGSEKSDLSGNVASNPPSDEIFDIMGECDTGIVLEDVDGKHYRLKIPEALE